VASVAINGSVIKKNGSGGGDNGGAKAEMRRMA